MKANFYNMIFIEDNFLPFHREGIPISLKDKYIHINGLGRYRIFHKPEEIKDTKNLEENFKDYSLKEPWVGEEKEQLYLYRAQINEDNLEFEKCNDEKNIYLQINTKPDDMITILNGKIFFRSIIDDKQIALVKFTENTMLTIEKEEGLIMIEFVDGDFICR
ncbi:MAG: hypothetical protein E7314_00275 [Clostridiales bacterium]|nr:hypothetical protein [Clostridiales bacterium]